MALTDKQKRFCEEYVVDLNATQAAIRAKYSPKTAQEQSSRLLSNVMVKAEIARLQAERSQRTSVDADWVVVRLVKEAEDRSEGATQGGRIRALELLGKHVGLFAEKVEHSGTLTQTHIYLPKKEDKSDGDRERSD